MAEVRINRSDNMPDVCLVCSDEKFKTVRIKLAKKDEASIVSVLFLPKILQHLFRLLPTIAWTLPFCAKHYYRQKIFQNMQFTMLLVGFSGLVLTIWTFCTTNQTYRPIMYLLLGFVSIIASNYAVFHPVRVNRYLLVARRVSDEFVFQHQELNRLSEELVGEAQSDFPCHQSEQSFD